MDRAFWQDLDSSCVQTWLRVDHRIRHNREFDLVGHLYTMLGVNNLRAVEKHPVFAGLTFDEAKSFENLRNYKCQRLLMSVTLALATCL